MSILDPVPIGQLLPIARTVSFSGDTLQLDTYALNPIRDAAKDPRILEVIATLQSRGRAAFGVGPYTSAAVAVGRELNVLKLGLIQGGPFMNLLSLDRAPLTGTIRDGRTYGELRSSIDNAERAYRVLEEVYPWETLGPEVYMVGAWREYAWADFQSLVHSGRVVSQGEFRDFITVTIVTDFDGIMDRMEAKVQAKLRKMERLATVRMVAMVGVGLALGVALSAVPALLAKKALGQLDAHQQADLGESLEEISTAFPESLEPFKAEVLRTVESLALRAQPVPARNADPANAQALEEKRASEGIPVLEYQPAVAPPRAERAPSIVDRIVAFFKNLIGGEA